MDTKNMLYVAIAVLVIIAAVTYVYLTSVLSAKFAGYENKPVGQQLLFSLSQTAMNSSLANRIGIGIVGIYPKEVNGSSLMVNGKQTLIYVGSDYCPYCAITRWSLIIALMRFGNFTSLHYMTSSASDVFPSTPTFTFYNSSYNSNYLTFLSAEITTTTGAPLQTPTTLQNTTLSKYDPKGSIPFIDIANRSIIQTQVLPSIVKGDSWQQIASQMNNPNSTISLGLIGGADVITAEICSANNFTPSSVCGQPYIKTVLRAING